MEDDDDDDDDNVEIDPVKEPGWDEKQLSENKGKYHILVLIVRHAIPLCRS
jgi:hypothetical protein